KVIEARQKASRMVDSEADITTDAEGLRKRRPPANEKDFQVKRKRIVTTKHFAAKTTSEILYPPPLQTGSNQGSSRSCNSQPHALPTANVAANVELTSTTTTPSSTEASANESDLEFQKVVLSSLSAIKLRLQHVEEMQEIILDVVRKPRSINGLSHSLKLPLTNMVDFDQVEQKVCSDENFYQEIVRF
ncbi:unnamed protein product, partial [Allacma fusca]